MANGVNVTDKGMQFLVSVDGSEAMSQLRQLQTSMKGLATEIEKSVGLTQKTFNKTFDSLGQLVKQLDKNPGVGIPGAASKDADKFAQKLNQELEKQRKKMNEGFVQARQGVSDLNKETNILSNSVESLGDDIGGVNDKLSDMVNFGPKLKGLAAGLLAAFGIEALVEEIVQLDENLYQLGRRFDVTGDAIYDSASKAATAVKTSTNEVTELLKVSLEAGNNNLELAASFSKVSTMMSKVFNVEAGTAQGTLERLRQKGLVPTEEAALRLGDAFKAISETTGASFAQMSETIERNSNTLGKLTERLKKAAEESDPNLDPSVALENAQKAARKFGEELTLVESLFRKVGGTDGVAQQLTDTLARMSIDPLNKDFAQFSSVVAKASGPEGLAKLRGALQSLATGDSTGMLKFLEDMDKNLQAAVFAMPADYLRNLFGGSVDDIKQLIANLRRVRDESGSITENVEALRQKTNESEDAGKALTEAWNAWRETVGGAWSEIYAKVQNLFTALANITREPLADMLVTVRKFLDVLGAAYNSVKDQLKEWGYWEDTVSSVGKAIVAAFTLGPLILFGKKLAGIFTTLKKIGPMLKNAFGAGPVSGGTMHDPATGRTVQLPGPPGSDTYLGRARRNIGGLRGGLKSAGGGGAFGALMAFSDVYDTFSNEAATTEDKITTVGSATGSVVGGAAGALLGSAFGPIGTMIGAQVGATLGDSLGSTLGEWAAGVDWGEKFEGALEYVASIGTSIAEFGAKFTDTAIEAFKSLIDWIVETIQKIPGFRTAMKVTEVAVESAGAIADAAGSVYNFFAGDDEAEPAPQGTLPSASSRAARLKALGKSSDGAGAMETVLPVKPTTESTTNSEAAQNSGAPDKNQGAASDNKAIAEGLEKLVQGQEKQTQTMEQIAVSQANATRVGGNPSATATQLQNMGNGAN